MSATKESIPEPPDDVCPYCLNTGYVRTWTGQVMCPMCWPDNGPDEPKEAA